MGAHEKHCNQGEYQNSCKYGDATCPALPQDLTSALDQLEDLCRNGDKASRRALEEKLENTNYHFQGSPKEMEAHLKKIKEEQDQWKKEQRQFEQEKEGKLWEHVKKQVQADEGVLDVNPKLAQCWSIAWDQGHSAGYREVVNYFRTFVELIR